MLSYVHTRLEILRKGIFVLKINAAALNLNMAKQQMSVDALITASKCSSATIQKAKQGKNILPRTVGKIAVALGVDPVEIVMEE